MSGPTPWEQPRKDYLAAHPGADGYTFGGGWSAAIVFCHDKNREELASLKALVAELKCTTADLAHAAERALASIDRINSEHGTFFVGPGFIQLARKTAEARAAIAKATKP